MKKLTAALLAFIMILTPVVLAEETEYKNEVLISYMDIILEYISENYRYDLTKEQMYETALKEVLDNNPALFEKIIESVFESLDKYSEYYDREEMKSFMNSLQASICGIGVNVQSQNGKIVVISPIENSPAYKAGILAGDVIVSVDGEDISGKDLTYAQSVITGEKGTAVKIGVQRNGSEEIIYFTIIRDTFEESTVAGTVIEDGTIGYIDISTFSTHTDEEMKKQLEDFDKKGIKKLIIDLRNNPGGDKDALVEALRMFCPKGPVFNIEYKNSKENETYYCYKDNSKKYKIVVLVNENSASASEAFAGTMKDTGVATIVGETTYGKGTVQTVNTLITGGGFKLTVGNYTTAKGNVVDGVGIVPDIEIKNKTCLLSEHPEIKDIMFAAVINENSSAESIQIIEQRLNLLGIYTGEVDGIYDANTAEAVKIFQQTYSHEVTGAMDIMTQVDLHNATRNIKMVIDNQYYKAVEVLK